jgi:DNA-binding transcriptional regulator YdaS (Cro superfamily)
VSEYGDMKNTLTPFANWLDAEHGRVSQLASALGIKPSAVTNWRNRRIPGERIPALENITGIRAAQLMSRTAVLLVHI